jgi:hypothetical protein
MWSIWKRERRSIRKIQTSFFFRLQTPSSLLRLPRWPLQGRIIGFGPRWKPKEKSTTTEDCWAIW